MTEQEWLASSDPEAMWLLLKERGEISDRKLRLFACACCRLIWKLYDEPCRRAVEVAEEYADGLATEEERFAAEHALPDFNCTPEDEVPSSAASYSIAIDRDGRMVAWDALRRSTNEIASHVGRTSKSWATRRMQKAEAEHRSALAHLWRDIAGNPFRPVSVAPAWLTPAVRNLAQSAYDSRLLPSGLLDTGRLGVLADALEEAGCSTEEILAHLRGPGPHVQGCWAVDSLLEKS